jgi:hypothetical protein
VSVEFGRHFRLFIPNPHPVRYKAVVYSDTSVLADRVPGFPCPSGPLGFIHLEISFGRNISAFPGTIQVEKGHFFLKPGPSKDFQT